MAELEKPLITIAAPLFARISPRVRARLAIVLVMTAALIFPLVNQNDADIDSAANALAFASLALGLNIVVGFAGLLDLGYAAFFAIGAYAYGVASSWQLQPQCSGFWEPFHWLDLVTRFHTAGRRPFPGLVLADVAGCRRDRRFLRRAVRRADLAAQRRLSGNRDPSVSVRSCRSSRAIRRRSPMAPIGLNGVAAPQLFGYDFGVDATPYYYVGVALVAFLILVSQRLKDSRIGRAWMAIREDEIAAATMGVDRVRRKLLAFAIEAAFAGATGTFYVAKLQTVTPEMFMFPVSVMVLVMIVFGGIGSV